jgi:hypothetical protein
MPITPEQMKGLRRALADTNTEDELKLTRAALEAGGLKMGVTDEQIRNAWRDASVQSAYDDPHMVRPEILIKELLGSEFAAKRSQLLENIYEQFVGSLEGGRRRRRAARKTRKSGKSRRRHTRKH